MKAPVRIHRHRSRRTNRLRHAVPHRQRRYAGRASKPIILQLLDLPQAQQMLRGVMMELEDCAFPLLQQVIITDDPKVAFRDTEIAMLIGSRLAARVWNARILIEAQRRDFSPRREAAERICGAPRQGGWWWATPPTPTH